MLLLLGLIATIVCVDISLSLAANSFIAARNAVQTAGFRGLKPREADLVTIGAVLEAPQQYHLHRVRFEGRISKIDTLPKQGGCRRFDSYLFRFEDETGSIEVIDTCATPESAPLLVVNPTQVGERVSIVVTINHSTHEPEPLIRARLQWIGASQSLVQ